MNTSLLHCCTGFIRFASLSAIVLLSFVSSALAHHQVFKPIVIYQTSLEQDSYLALIDVGISKFEQKAKVPVIRMQVDSSVYVHALRQSAAQGYTPIVVVESSSLDNFDHVARANPSVHFISLDVAYHIPNVLGLTFNHAEGSYILGYLAGLKTQSNQVGFVGGLDVAPINDFKCGFELGMKDANPDANLTAAYINKGLDSWDDVDSANQIAQAMLEQDIDIIFPAAGHASIGVMEAVKQAGNALSFGVDHDYSQEYPQTVLASLEKKTDVAVFASLMQLKNAIWNGNRKHFGLKQGVINVLINHQNPKLTESDKRLVEKLVTDFKGNNNQFSQKVARLCQSKL